jgi:predicted acetyltransferase
MVAEVRRIRADEVPDFVRSVAVPFLEPGRDGSVEHWTPHIEPDRAWVADDGGRLVGNACVFSRDVTVPAGPGRPCSVLPMAAISGVGVHPSHHRQGILRRLMASMLEDARDRGEVIAALIASESVIYGRFGFGLATTTQRTRIDTRESRFDVPVGPADIRLLEPDEASKVLPDLHDRCRRVRAGEPSRTDAVWAETFTDAPQDRGGMSGRMYAVAPDGFAVYRGQEADELEGYARVRVQSLYGETPEAEAALWRFLFDIDLVREVVAERPVDDPLRWRLADPRQLRVTASADKLWVCVLDTAAALQARGYERSGRLVLDIAPPATPVPAGISTSTIGRWVLEAGPDGASCQPVGGEQCDLRMGLADLSALYMGGVRASTLAAAGRVHEERPGALAVADAIFMTTREPFCGTGF